MSKNKNFSDTAASRCSLALYELAEEKKMAENNADKKLKCSECSMKCLKRNLTKHMDNAHKPCPYCEYNTKIGTENINNHIKDNHPDSMKNFAEKHDKIMSGLELSGKII